MQPVPKTRNVSYCIISLKPLPQNYDDLLKKSVDKLTQQSYKQWHAVYFVSDLNQSQLDYATNVRLLNTSQYEGLDLQRAAVTHCNPSDMALILDYDESLGYNTDLKRIE